MPFNSESNGAIVWINAIKTDELFISAPTNLHATFLSYDSIGFSWNSPSFAQKILVYREVNNQDFTILDTLPSERNTYSDKDVSKGNIYNYRLLAMAYGVNSEPSNILAVNTNEYTIQAPYNLYVRQIHAKSLELRWADVSLSETGYKVLRKNLSNGSITTFKLPVNSNSFTDEGLSPEQQYLYTVLAYTQTPYDEKGSSLTVQTLSLSEEQREFSNLVAYYNFQYVQNNQIPDLSGYEDPLNLQISEPVSSVKSEKGAINILYPAHVKSVEPASKIVNACKQSNEVSIELWVNSTDNSFTPSTIISLANDSSDIGFEIQQDIQGNSESPYYKVLLQTKSTFSNGLPALQQSVPHRGNSLNHVVFTHNNNGDDYIYVNGELVGQGFKFPSLNTWKDNFYLTLADNGTSQQPFIGSIYLCAIYNNALSEDQVVNNYLAGPYDGIVTATPSLNAAVSPNPVTDFVTLEVEKLDESLYFDNLYYKLADSYGHEVFSNKLPYIEFDKLSKQIDMSNLEPGLYFLYISNSSTILSTLKIVKLPGQ